MHGLPVLVHFKMIAAFSMQNLNASYVIVSDHVTQLIVT